MRGKHRLWLQEHQDRVARAIVRAFQRTGFDEEGIAEREGVALVRQELILMFEETGDGIFDYRRFADITQPLSSAVARDVELRDRLSEKDDDDPEPEEKYPDEAEPSEIDESKEEHK